MFKIKGLISWVPFSSLVQIYVLIPVRKRSKSSRPQERFGLAQTEAGLGGRRDRRRRGSVQKLAPGSRKSSAEKSAEGVDQVPEAEVGLAGQAEEALEVGVAAQWRV